MNKVIFFEKIWGLCILAVIMIYLPEGTIANKTFSYWLSFRLLVNFSIAVFTLGFSYIVVSLATKFHNKKMIKLFGLM